MTTPTPLTTTNESNVTTENPNVTTRENIIRQLSVCVGQPIHVVSIGFERFRFGGLRLADLRVAVQTEAAAREPTECEHENGKRSLQRVTRRYPAICP